MHTPGAGTEALPSTACALLFSAATHFSASLLRAVLELFHFTACSCMDAEVSPKGDQKLGDAAPVEENSSDSVDNSLVLHNSRSADIALQLFQGTSEVRQLLNRLALSYDNEDYLTNLMMEMRHIISNCNPAQARSQIAVYLKQCIREKNATSLGPAPQINLSNSDFSSFPPLKFGHYQQNFKELRKVGSGGFGTVYLSVHKVDGNTYCIKKVRITGPRELDQSKMIKKVGRAMREARCLSQLSHPNVIRYYNSWLEYTSPEVPGTRKPDDAASSAPIAHEQPHLSSPTKQKEAPVELTAESSEKSLQSNAAGRFSPPLKLRFESMEFIGDTSTAGCGDDLSAACEPVGCVDGDGDVNFDSSHNNALIKLQNSNISASASSIEGKNDYSSSSSEGEGSRELSDHVASQLVRLDSASSNFDITLYLQMEACRIEFTLADLIGLMRDGHDVPIVDRIRCMCELAEALQHVHLSGIVHRDVKPANIFFKFPYSVKLADFGLSKESADDPVMDEIIKFSGVSEDVAGIGSNGSNSPSLGALVSDYQLTTSCGTVSCASSNPLRPFPFCRLPCPTGMQLQSSALGTWQPRLPMCFLLVLSLQK
jgi:serine/threonine protein kinase